MLFYLCRLFSLVVIIPPSLLYIPRRHFHLESSCTWTFMWGKRRFPPRRGLLFEFFFFQGVQYLFWGFSMLYWYLVLNTLIPRTPKNLLSICKWKIKKLRIHITFRRWSCDLLSEQTVRNLAKKLKTHFQNGLIYFFRGPFPPKRNILGAMNVERYNHRFISVSWGYLVAHFLYKRWRI